MVVAASPVAIVPRAHLDDWRSAPPLRASTARDESPLPRSSTAQAIQQALQRHGAMFTNDLERATGLLRPQLEDGLKVLVYEGLVSADAFSPLRWLLRPEQHKARMESRRGRHGVSPVGRWSLLQPLPTTGSELGPASQRQGQLAHICQALLRRYGVVFRAVLQREGLLPPWRELLYALRRMEDRGEVRGGRFVDGFSGEQFALPEALGLLRQCVEPGQGGLRVISATDPLNLGGFILPGPRTPAVATHRVLLEDGLPVARWVGEQVEELPGISAAARHSAPDLLRVVMPWRPRRGGMGSG
jgi:ATP-dependent Lhr-like helicase